MKTAIKTFLFLLLAGLILCACHKDEDNLFADAVITLSGENMTIQRVQGTVTLTNLNSRQVVTSAEFNSDKAYLQLLRGSYSVLIEGTVQYRDTAGQLLVKQFRASTDYAGFEKESGNELTLDIILME